MRVTRDVGHWSIVPEWVIDAEVSDRAVRLYALLGRYADANGSSFASRRKLADRMRCSVDSVDRAIVELRAVGALHVEKRQRDDGSYRSSLYTLKTAAPVQGGSRTGAEGGSRTGAATMNESHKERETSIAAAPRKRNEIWDALTHMFGEPTTPSAVKLRGKVAQELRSVRATHDEILARGKRWPLHFDNATLTETALVKHWDRLGRKPLRAGGR